MVVGSQALAEHTITFSVLCRTKTRQVATQRSMELSWLVLALSWPNSNTWLLLLVCSQSVFELVRIIKIMYQHQSPNDAHQKERDAHKSEHTFEDGMLCKPNGVFIIDYTARLSLSLHRKALNIKAVYTPGAVRPMRQNTGNIHFISGHPHSGLGQCYGPGGYPVQLGMSPPLGDFWRKAKISVTIFPSSAPVAASHFHAPRG